MVIPWKELQLINPVQRLSVTPSPGSAWFNARYRTGWNPNYRNPGDPEGHGGLDLHDYDRGPALAPIDGPVVQAGQFGTNTAAGDVCCITKKVTGGWFLVRMLHFEDGGLTVKVGDTVTAGDRIGNVGCKGQCAYPHIHLEVRYLTVPFDPRVDSVNQGVKLDPLAFGVLPGVESPYYSHLVGDLWPTLALGGSDDMFVPRLKALLLVAGYRATVMPGVVYTRWVEKQVTKFQRANGLTVDGVFGPKTRAALYARVERTNR